MQELFKITDTTGRAIHLSKKTWNKHIRKNHPEVEDAETIRNALLVPTKLTHPFESKGSYYKYFKHRRSAEKYLMVAVKYLNGTGFVITAYFVKYIR